MSLIFKNMVLQYVKSDVENRIRVIWIDPQYTYTYIVQLKGEGSFPIMVDINQLELEVETDQLIEIKDPFAKTFNEEDLPQHIKENRDKAWEVIEYLTEDEQPKVLRKAYRTKQIKQAALKFEIEDYTIKRLLKRYWQRGMVKNALISDYMNSGAKGKTRSTTAKKRGRPRRVGYHGQVEEGINIDESIQKLFRISIDKFYRSKEKLSLMETYHFMLQKFFSDRYQLGNEEVIQIWDKNRIPTYHQFYYWYSKEKDIKKDFISRNSEKAFASEHRELLGNATIETYGPGSRYEVDATIADVYLTSSVTRTKVIGRPVVYAIIDVYSRMITGCSVLLEGPSWIGAMMALENAVTDKVEYCQKFGIDINEDEWPCQYLPEAILADRGEFEGYKVESLINNLNVKVENTSSYRGDLKGIVERQFRTINEKIKHTTPGAIQKEYRERGDRDYRLDATLTLEEFNQIMIRLILHHNKKVMEKYPLEKGMLADEVNPIPIEIWRWGMKHRKGRFNKHHLDVVRLNLLPKGKASCSRGGIKFKNLFYSTKRAIEEQWYLDPKMKTIGVVYDPRNMNYIYIPNYDGKGFIKCSLLEKSYMYKDLRLEEIVFQEELKSERHHESIDGKNQNHADMDLQIEQIIKHAKEEMKKESSNQSKRSKIKNIRQNRTEEKERNQEKESFELNRREAMEGEVISLPKKEENKSTIESSSTNTMLERLKKKRDEKLGRK